MNTLHEAISSIIFAHPYKLILSKPHNKQIPYRKITIEKKEAFYQLSQYTQKQVFHKNISFDKLAYECEQIVGVQFMQLNAWDETHEHILLMSAKGHITYKTKQTKQAPLISTHNRKKHYIFEEGIIAPPLVDMGILTKEGKVVQSMYDKFKQINRFIELIDDEIKKLDQDHLTIIDFGCGKSYLTFVLYYYLTEIKHISTHIIGLDLKEDVINHCNATAKKYGYEHLHFELGDINGYHAPCAIDMVISLHACDVATDFSIYNAIRWNAKLIFAVPCCQHELNKQITSKHLPILTRYGLMKERFCAIATDTIRANLLECCGYKTQIVEFVDFAHTPKNVLIRAVFQSNMSLDYKKKAFLEVQSLLDEFQFSQTLYQLLANEHHFESIMPFVPLTKQE